MIALNKDIRNINFLSSAFTNSSAQMAHLSPNVAMDVNDHNVNNYDNVRGRKYSPSNVFSRSASVSSSTSSISYHHRMTINNDLPDQKHVEPINNSQLSYSSDSRNNN